MAVRQGIVLGPIAQTQRNSFQLLVTTGYTSPIPPYNTGYAQDGTNLSNASAGPLRTGQVIYGYHHLALKRLIETANSHYHQYQDYYQVPTYGGAYGNYGYTDANGGAGDRNSYYEVKNTGYPQYHTVINFKGIYINAYNNFTYPTTLPITTFYRGYTIYASDYNILRTAITELGDHGHTILDRTSK